MADWLEKYKGLKGEPLIPNGVTKYFRDQKPYTNADKQFIDETFPPTDDSLLSTKCCWNFGHSAQVSNQGSYHWVKPDSFLGSYYCVYDDQVSQNDLRQGSLGDCYFLAALSAMTEFPGLVDQLFRGGAKKSSNGYYEVFMFIDEEWQIVIIDDFVPALNGSNFPQFVRPSRNAIWPLLLEKVWAKINDGYSNIIAGKSIWPLHLLTGFPCSIHFFNMCSDLHSLWNKLTSHDSRNDIMTCSSYKDGLGIVSSHMYTLKFAGNVTDEYGNSHKLVCLRNPWGNSEWQGDWSDNSTNWTDGMKKKLGVENKDDGVFWMNFNDFLLFFDGVEFAHSPNYFNDVSEFHHSDSLPKIYRVEILSLSTLSVNVFNEMNFSDFQCSLFLTKDERVIEASLVQSKSHYSGRIYNLQAGKYYILVYPKNDLKFKVKFSVNGSYIVFPNYRYDKNNVYLSKLVRSGNFSQNYTNSIKGTQFEKLISSLSDSYYDDVVFNHGEFDYVSPDFRRIGNIPCLCNMICLEDQNVNIHKDFEKLQIKNKEKDEDSDDEASNNELECNKPIVFQQNVLIKKRQNFTMKYLIVNFPQQRIFKNVYVQVEMRDQGWSSSDSSGSWVEARIEDMNGKEIHKERLFENIAVPQWKIYSVNINEDHSLFQYMNDSYTLNIYAMSAWAGWEIWVKSARCVLS